MKKLFSKLEIFKVINSEFIKPKLIKSIKQEVIKPIKQEVIKPIKQEVIKPIKQEVIKQEVIKQEVIKPIKQEVIKEEVIKQEVIKQEVIKPIKQEVIKQEVIKEEVIKQEVIKQEVIKEEVIKQEIVKEEVIKQEVVKQVIIPIKPEVIKPIKQEVIEQEIIKQEIIKPESIRQEIQNLTCYCIINKEKTRTYVGATNKFSRRIRQHNREITGGAKATYGYKWDSIIFVEGFKNRSELLSFEWHFKHKKTVHKSGITRRLESLNILFKDDRWQHLNINIISELIDKIDYLNKNILKK
jgi:predicted GIY-YIG superfamily endonuclease